MGLFKDLDKINQNLATINTTLHQRSVERDNAEQNRLLLEQNQLLAEQIRLQKKKMHLEKLSSDKDYAINTNKLKSISNLIKQKKEELEIATNIYNNNLKVYSKNYSILKQVMGKTNKEEAIIGKKNLDLQKKENENKQIEINSLINMKENLERKIGITLEELQ